ncbi:hypothetical protein [Lysinibacillus sp. LZ02]|uniref:hypothetical protein n=1 Tax=Lysinibacillus sp. LZ02 TaxID=3420668 RepID=UPI003D360C2A
MNYAIQAHLLKGSNVVFMDKNHIKNAETQEFDEVTVYLSKKEIIDLYTRMNNVITEND